MKLLHTQTTTDGETLVLVTLNSIPYWRDVQSGRTFPQVAGGEDPPTGDGDTSDDGTSDENADDEDTADLDKARRRIQALRAGEKRLRDALKAQNSELQSLKGKQREIDEATLSETERLRNRTVELEREVAEKERERQELRNVRSVERAAAKYGAADPEDIYRLLEPSEFEHDEQGNVTNADALVKALLEKKPYLKKQSPNGVPATPRSNGEPRREDEVKKKQEQLIATGRYNPLV